VSDTPKKPDARAVILARRAHFVAAAMASLGIACGKEQQTPQPCLSVVQLPADAGPVADSTLDASAPAEAGAAAADGAPPGAGSTTGAGQVGATPKRDAGAPALPRPCLKVAPPRKDDAF
jgi:hypothetical protein